MTDPLGKKSYLRSEGTFQEEKSPKSSTWMQNAGSVTEEDWFITTNTMPSL